jgi:flagellar hook assembly protein FlgD
MGRLVREVVNESQPAGVHKVAWDGKGVNGALAPSGVYFIKLRSPGVNKTSRFVVVR